MSLTITTRMIAMAPVAALCGLLIAGNAAAGETYPKFSGGISIEVQYDDTHDADDPAAELSDLYTTTEPELVVEFQPGLSLLLHGVLEPVQDATDDRTFEDHGLYVQELYLGYEGERFSLLGGKFSPNFGTAWDATPGVYGTDFAADYEITEQIGAQGAAKLDDWLPGAHRLSLGTFFVDTTSLGESAFDNRGRTTKSAGGVGNTEDFSSFAIALDGGDIAAAPGLSYHLAHLHRAAGRGDATDERAIAVGGQYQGEAGPLSLAALAEVAWFDDADGVRDQDRDYLTAGLQLGWRAWNLAVSGTGRDMDVGGNDQLLQISAGYQFDIGLTVDVGWKTTDEGGSDADTVGILFTYGFEF
ncbi:MAG: hypothetical protein QF491_03970 [Alphaproteobacteria bacterium]|jgi:hypothetical protein|nr:hypothetical protein [Alphaproteobacteria bacterium]